MGQAVRPGEESWVGIHYVYGSLYCAREPLVSWANPRLGKVMLNRSRFLAKQRPISFRAVDYVRQENLCDISLLYFEIFWPP